MNRKLLTIAIAAIVGLAIVIGVLTAVMFSGRSSDNPESREMLSQSRYELLSCVPTDAIAVVVPSNLQSAVFLYTDDTVLGWAPVTSAAVPAFRGFMRGLGSMISEREVQSLKGARAVVSFHYTGELLPLLVIEDTKGTAGVSTDAEKVLHLADSLKLVSEWCGSRIFVSTSDIVLQAGLRHQASDASVADADGFAQAASAVSGETVLLVCAENCGKIFSTIVANPYLKYADFFKSLGSWAAFSLETNTSEKAVARGMVNSSEGVHQFLKAFDNVKPAASTVASVLPASTAWFFTMPTSDLSDYIKAYQSYADSRIGISRFLSRQKALADEAHIAPKAWFGAIEVKEAAVAEIDIKGSVERFILLRPGKPDATCKEGLNEFPYGGFVGSVLGKFYNVPDESCSTFIDGWLIIGSRNGVSAFVQTNLLENRLADAPALAAHAVLPSDRSTLAYLWMRMTGNGRILREIFEKNFESGLESASYGDEESFMLAIQKSRSGSTIVTDLVKPQVVQKKKKDSSADSGVVVPEGPFTVKNSGTGKDNLLSCSAGRLSLTEDGNELWAVAFDGNACGRASCVDFFRNNKLQFLFCSGNKLHLYDRLGRPVEGFPVILDKEVLLGPDVYDFSKGRKYNIIVLNADNTIDMYNLQGQKPASWKAIAPQDKITDLPEYVTRGSKSYWAVHTTSQTFVYPFYGGEPVAEYDGFVTGDQINVE